MTALRMRLAQSKTSITGLEVFASGAGLFALAISQPILDLLGRNPEFFVARSAPTVDILLVAVGLGLIAPILVGTMLLAIRRLSARAGTAVHASVVTFLSGLLLLQVTDSIGPGWLIALALACVGGVVIVASFYLYPSFRLFTKLAGIAPVVVVITFIVLTPASRLVFSGDAITGPTGITVNNPVPIVMVVLDELPLASIIDERGDIEASHYPNFARLASSSYWFRNAVTNESNTEKAVPALLTGSPAPPDSLPVFADHPENLFTFLDGLYEINALESITAMCPHSVCEETDTVAWRERWEHAIDDLSVVALHVLLPSTLTHDLPPIDETWSDFGGLDDAASATEGASSFDLRTEFHDELESGRREPIERFIDTLEVSTSPPSLHFAHILLPHSPWEYLPDGTLHRSPQPPHGANGPGWGDDEWLVAQIYQRHLLQVQYVDTLLGRMLDRLEAQNAYDETLLVVLADHGIGVEPGMEHRRRLSETNVGHIAAVPLFIKPPGTSTGSVDSYRAELVDVLPTVADVIDVELPTQLEGTSLLGHDRPVRRSTSINAGSGTIGVEGQEKFAVAAWRIELFGTEGPYGLAPTGTGDLLGISMDRLPVTGQAELRAEIFNASRYQEFDSSTPTYFQGRLVASTDGPFVIAISVNGEVAAVTRSYMREDVLRFQALLPPTAMQAGSNTIELLLVESDADGRVLTSIPVEAD